MINFANLKIRNKLRVLSLLSFLSLIVLGYVSNYFYDTGRTLGLIINAERVHNNTFQEGIENYYRYQITKDTLWLDRSIVKIDEANQMARNFGIVDQLAQLSEDEFVDILFENYRLAYNEDRSNAELMANRIKFLLVFKPVKMVEAQQIALKGAELGEVIKTKILEYKSGKITDVEEEISEDLVSMRIFYDDFANSISSLNNYAHNLLYVGMFLVVVLLIVTIAFISTLISKSISNPVSEMVSNFRVIAMGNLDVELSINSKNEIGELASSFKSIQEGLRKVIMHAKKVADGDYSGQITPRSSKDEMSIALNKMVEELRVSHDKVKQDSWFKSGLNEINARLNSDHSLTDIANKSISLLMDLLQAQIGSTYLYNTDYKHLKLLSASGVDTRKLKKKVKLNEGIIGQVAESMKIQVIKDVPEELYSTFSSVGEYKPKQIVIVPMVFNKALVGVLELSSLREYSELELEFLKQASEIIAIKINSAESRIKTGELLQKTQDQASELQVQQEELRVANEELTEHTQVLTENEKKLQVQQEELRVANEELEERTGQLEMQKEDISIKNKELIKTHEELEVKATELQQASQYKSEFLANMSHELRTPLNSLLILSNLLSSNKKGNLSDDQVQSAKIIHKSGSDLLHLINEILDLSKIEAGKMSLELNSVNTTDLKEEVLMNFNAMADDKGLALDVAVNEEFPEKLNTDRYRLMQIVKNLLSNAFKFTSKGTVSVYFTTTPDNTVFRSKQLAVEQSCCIRIADTGVGIPPEKMESIFEAFQQADGSISRKFGGTGLGLSISRELINLLGGEIQLESVVGKGSTFNIYLPFSHSELDSNEKLPSADDLPSIEEKNDVEIAKPIEEEKVLPLFIDDDRDENPNGRTVLVIHPSRDQANKFLQQARMKNFRAIVAQNILDGIEIAEKYSPKAIMLAVEYTKDPNYLKLKEHKLFSKLPVHIITPIDYTDSDDHGELKTLETTEFTDALKSLESYFTSPLKKILIVEDNAVTRGVIKTMLFELNLEIKEAGMADEAFNILNYETFDCIILDLGLPDYSGMELLKKLKSNNITIPKVIVYTGKEMSKDEIKELNDYTDTIILKGIKSDDRLMDEITLFLHQVSKQIPELKEKPAIANDDSLFKGKKILVVDDDIRNVFALGNMLEEREMEVVDADNGQVAIDMLKENQDIDLILMDVMMPVMDGYEAMQIIRKTPEVKNIPIICLTAKAMKEDHENALRNGANDYLAKPLNEEKLFSMLKIWLYEN